MTEISAIKVGTLTVGHPVVVSFGKLTENHSERRGGHNMLQGGEKCLTKTITRPGGLDSRPIKPHFPGELCGRW